MSLRQFEGCQIRIPNCLAGQAVSYSGPTLTQTKWRLKSETQITASLVTAVASQLQPKRGSNSAPVCGLFNQLWVLSQFLRRPCATKGRRFQVHRWFPTASRPKAGTLHRAEQSRLPLFSAQQNEQVGMLICLVWFHMSQWMLESCQGDGGTVSGPVVPFRGKGCHPHQWRPTPNRKDVELSVMIQGHQAAPFCQLQE